MNLLRSFLLVLCISQFFSAAAMGISASYLTSYVSSWWRGKQAEVMPNKANVAVIELVDPINFKDSVVHLISAAKNPAVDGVVLMINCGGGSTGAFSVLHDHIKKLATLKPVVALVGESAGSSGYLITSAADYIIASGCSNLGCIGTVWEIATYKNPKYKGNNLEAGIDVEQFNAGEFKSVGSPYHPLSNKDKEYIKKYIARIYQYFLETVAANRKLDMKKYKEWAEAKLFISPDALKLGLIDAIGTFFEAEEKVLELICKRNPEKTFAPTLELIYYNNSPAPAN